MSLRCPKCGSSYDAGAVTCPRDRAVLHAVPAADRPDALLGSALGGYVVVREVAEGAMGRVYEGRHPKTLERVAIKVLHDEVAGDPVSVERFRREYETLRRIEHPHVLRVISQGSTPDGSYYMAMEHLEGEELARVLSREGALKPARTVRIVTQLALALEHAHRAGFVHRDLKPENIFLCPTEDGDHVKVLDFGVVKVQEGAGPQLTAFGTALGSPCYMSPEQAMGKRDVDSRTDVFATGAILHELATGRICFDGATVAEIMMAIVRYHPPLCHLENSRYPAAYGAVVDRALAKDREKRPSGMIALAAEMLDAFGLEPDVEGWSATPESYLAQFLAGGGGAARPSDAPPSDTATSELDVLQLRSAPEGRRNVPTYETTQPVDALLEAEAAPPPHGLPRAAARPRRTVGAVVAVLALALAAGAAAWVLLHG